MGRAFGFTTRPRAASTTTYRTQAGAVIGFEARTPILGFNVPEAVLLGTPGARSTTRFSSTCQAHVERCAVQPRLHLLAVEGHELGGSREHGWGGKPDVPNTGFVVQGDSGTSTRTTHFGLRSSPSVQRQLYLGAPGPGRCSAASACSGSCSSSRGCRTRSMRPSRSSAAAQYTATSFAVRVASIVLASDGPACAARSTSCVSRATTRPRRRSARARSARR